MAIAAVVGIGLQMLIPNFALMGIGFYTIIMIFYFFIENPDLLIADELVKLQKNNYYNRNISCNYSDRRCSCVCYK